MPSDIGARMSVSGVASFKSAMAQGKSAVKALDAELKLSAAQYKASGDAEQYMADRSRILSQQIRAQEDVVANAQKALEQMASQGVDKASTAYTQMQATLARARTDLVNMQQAATQTGAELSEAADSGQKMADSLGSIDKTGKLNTLTSAISRIDDMLTGMLTKVVNIGKGIWDWGRAGSEWADDLATNAYNSGLDVETYQQWELAAQKADVSIDSIVKATDRLTKATKGAEDGIAVIETETGQWGINLKDTSGAMRSQMDVFWDFVDILQSVENETERNTLAQDYFGKSYRELSKLFEIGRAGWEEAASTTDVVSEENINNLTAFNDALAELDQKWQSTTMTVLAELAPSFERISDALGRVLDRISEWAQSEEGQEALASIGNSVATLIENLADGEFFEKMFQGAVDAISSIASFLEDLTGDDIIHGLEVIAGIIGGIKLASATIEGLRLMQSLGLIGGGNGTTPTTGGGNWFKTGNGNWKDMLINLVQTGGAAIMLHEMNAETQEDRWEYQTQKWAYEQSKEGGFNGAAGKFVNWLIGDPEQTRYWESNEIARQTADNLDQRFIEAMRVAGYDPNFAFSLEAAVAELTRAATGHEEKVTQWGVDSAGGLVGVDVNGNIVPINEQALADAAAWRARINQRASDNGVGWLGEDTSFYSRKGEYSQFYWQNFLKDFGGINYGKYYAEEMSSGIEESTPEVEAAGADLGAQIPEGALEQVSAAFGAGVALASAFVAGASSVGAPGGGSSSTYNSSYVNSVNFFGAMTAQEVTNAYRTYTQTQQAGYGG